MATATARAGVTALAQSAVRVHSLTLTGSVPQTAVAVRGVQARAVPLQTTSAVAGVAAVPVAPPAPLPVGDLTGWRQVYTEDFDVAYPIGSFVVGTAGSADDGLILSSSPAYGRYRSKIKFYPDGVDDTYHAAKNYVSKTVSTRTDVAGANGVLDVFLHTETIAGTPTALASWMRALLPSGQATQLYGRFSARMRADSLPGYGTVQLLITDPWPANGEQDWPEGDLSAPVAGFYHFANAAGGQQAVSTAASWQDWHVYTIEWSPGRARWFIDDTVVLDTTNQVGATANKYIIQSGGSSATPPAPDVSGHLQVDWITVYEMAATPSPNLFYAMPANILAQTRKAFALYFSPYGLSRDNKPAANDLYQTAFLNPAGQNGLYAANGGLFRNRPLDQAPGGSDYLLQNARVQIQRAMDAGIDGFFADILGASGNNWNNLVAIRDAANTYFPGQFYVIPLLDGGGTAVTTSDTATCVSTALAFANLSSTYYLPDGSMLLASFKAEANTEAWWQSVISGIASGAGKSVSFAAVFLSSSQSANYLDVTTIGGLWGMGSDPGVIANYSDFASTVKGRGQKWMTPITPNNIRAGQSTYDEALGTGALRAGWARAIADGADYVQGVTWNDYSETTSLEPSVCSGYVNVDLWGYYNAYWKTGTKPAILTDAIYLSHRNQLLNATPQFVSTDPMVQRTQTNMTAAADKVEILTFLTAAATVTVKVGPNTYSYTAPAGENVQLYPLALGAVSATAVRSSATVATIASPIPVTASPIVQDRQYYRFSSLRPTSTYYTPSNAAVASPTQSAVRVHSLTLTAPGSRVKVHSLSLAGALASGSRVRVHSASLTGTIPSSTGSRVRLHSLQLTGRVAIPRPTGGRIWDPATKTWSALKMRLLNKASLNWDVILGSPDSTVVNDGLDHSSPVADAGAKPLGTASYNVSATSMFVSLQGSDAGAGTIASPYRTLTKAVSMLPAAGGQITIRGGSPTSPWVYEGEGTTSLNIGLNVDKQVVIQNYPGEAVIFDGSQVLTGWTTDTATWKAPYTVVTDRSPTFTRGAADSTVANFGFINPDYPCAAWPDQVWVDGVVQTQVDSKAKVTAGTFWVEGAQSGMTFTPTNLYLGSNPAGHEIRVTRMNKSIRLAGAGSTIRGFQIQRYSPTLCDFGMMSMSAQDSTVENMILVDSASIGISISSRSGMTVRYTTVWNSGALGIHVNNADGHVVEKANVQYSNRERWNYAPVSGHIKITRSQGSIVRNSILSNGHCKAYWDDETVDQAWIYSCLMENNEHRALVHELSSNAITLNNKIIGSTLGGILVFNSDLSRTWNNTVVDTGGLALSRMVGVYQDDRNALDGVTTGRDTRQPDSYYTDYPEHQWRVNSYEMCNNVVALPRTSNPQSMFGFERLSPTGTYNAPGRTFLQYGPTQDGNFWNNINTVLSKAWIVPNGTNAATVYADLAAFTAATGQDTHGTYVSGRRAVNADGTLLTADRVTANAGARPLPADLAALIGQPAGAKWAGCFW